MLICRTLKHYHDTLQDCGFCRVHRSSLINLDYVTKYNKGKGGNVELSNGKQVMVSASKKSDLLSYFK